MLLKTKRPRAGAGAEAIFGVDAHFTAPARRAELSVRLIFSIRNQQVSYEPGVRYVSDA
jgi:hypothetical protein